MPKATCERVNEPNIVVRTVCCSSLVQTRFNVSIDGKSLISGTLQFNLDNGTPNIENVARDRLADPSITRATFLLVYFMLGHLQDGKKFSSVRVAAAHDAVLALTRAHFVQTTNNPGKVAGQELMCTDLDSARAACRVLFAEKNTNVNFT
jgi:hypothetical protein